MRANKLLTFLIALGAIVFAVVSPVRAGTMSLLGVGGPPVVATYQGPGDIVSGASTWYGLRAYSSAKRGTKAINLCDNTGANCTDILTNATTGLLNNPGTLGSNNCATSGTCQIATWYDQSGALSCGGSACDATQSTAADRPTLKFSCINSLPCAVFSGSSQFLTTPATYPSITAFTISSVSIRTGAFTSQGNIISVGATITTNLDYRALANSVQMYNGTTGQFISNITDNNFHAMQNVYNGASSVLFCGGSAGTACSNAGTSNAISPGTQTSTANSPMCIGGLSSTTCSGGDPLTGEITEVGVWNSTVFNSTQQTNMNSNQITFWGPF